MGKLLLFGSALLLGSCGSVQFKTIPLYDHYEVAKREVRESATIYDDAEGTMWSYLSTCGDFEVSQEAAYSGKSSIKVSWDRANMGCEWAGFGNTFSNWMPTDLSESREYSAISFFIRTQQNTARTVPIVLALEDVGEDKSYLFVDAKKYLYGLEIDTNWKQVIVPLWDFPVGGGMVDITAIKQVIFALEGGGSFYLDQLEVIDYTREEYAQMRKKVEEMKPNGTPNHVCYRSGKFAEDVWGCDNNPCQVLEERQSEEGGSYIYWEFDAPESECEWTEWGINWNGYYQVNLRGMEDKAQIRFRYRTENGAQFKIRFEDFRYHKFDIFTSPKESSGWQTVTIPLKDLKLKEKGFVYDQTRQFRFVGLAPGKVYLDELIITPL